MRSISPPPLPPILLAISLALLSPAGAGALEYGLNCGAPIVATGQITGSVDPDAMKATGAEWVRVNFILSPWTSPGDTTRRGPENLTWYETYDRIIDGYVSRGVKVYGLIGAESVLNASRDRLNTEGFVGDLTTAAETIIGHYRDRVGVYEIFNEPNDWAGGSTSQVEPYWLARYIESVYRAVKLDNGHADDSTWQAITLVTGPIFTHDLDTGGGYLSQVFQAGTNQLGWEAIKEQTGTYPFDGIGFHVYVKQGFESNAEVAQYLTRNLDSVWSAVTALEGSNTFKKLYISEFGWNSFYTNEETQASKMDAAFDLFETDSRVAQAQWFTLTDWGDNDWGIYRQEPYIVANRKAAYDVFLAHATSGPPRDDAALESVSIPVWFEPGQSRSVGVDVRNVGTSTWTAGNGTDRMWSLAAGSVGAGFAKDNAFAWSAFGSGGVSVSPTDQTAWLAGDTAPGVAATFSFNATAPALLPRGPKPFVAGLWKKDVGLIGIAAAAEPLVVFREESSTTNGDFEQVDLTGWTVFGQMDGVQSGSWFAGISASRGSHFIGAAANYGQKNGGLYQTVDAVPGGRYGAVVQIQTYREGGAAGDTACRVGIDPSGGVDPNANEIAWSAWTENQGDWIRIAARATAASDRITVFLQARGNAPTWNVMAFDDAIVGGPRPGSDGAGFVAY